MRTDGFTLIEAAIVAAIIALLFAVFIGPALTCERQAKAMGMRHSWGFFKGCMVEPKPGQWVPLANYRVL